MAATAFFSALQCFADHRDLLQDGVVDLDFLFFLFVLLCFLLWWSLLCFIFYYTLPLSKTMYPLITALPLLNNSLTYSERNYSIFFHTLYVSPLPKTQPDLYKLLLGSETEGLKKQTLMSVLDSKSFVHFSIYRTVPQPQFLIWGLRWNSIWGNQWELNQSLGSCSG